MKTTERVETIKPSDVIMPPPREVSLWMRRTLAERGLAEEALYLTVTEIYEGAPDKRGRWLVVVADFTPEWNANKVNPSPFKFKARPETPWTVIKQMEVAA